MKTLTAPTLTLLPALAGLALALLTLLTLSALWRTAPAQWTNDPWNGMVPVCTAEGWQQDVRIIRLSSNRTLITWIDSRNNPLPQAYYQLLDSDGVPLLQPNGILIFSCSWQTGAWYIVPNGEGGAVAVLVDNRDGSWDVYGQRFDSLGNRLWGDTGRPLILWPGPDNVILKDVNLDSLGHIFLSWVYDDGSMYLQKCTIEGQRLWGDYGVVVCSGPNDHDWQQSVPDEQGGILDVWSDNRTGTYRFYAQHLNALGQALWITNGIALTDPQSGAPLSAYGPTEGVSDGSGGGVWSYDTYWNWYLFRLSGAGEVQWLYSNYSAETVSVVTTLFQPSDSSIWVTTHEDRGTGIWNYYLYRINVQGISLLPSTGIAVGGQPAGFSQILTSDGCMIFNVAWTTQRTRLAAQRRDNSGALVWRSDVALGGTSQAGGPCFYYNTAIPDGQDGAIVAFGDARFYETDPDISAQRVSADGSLGTPLPPRPYAPDWPQYNLSMIGQTIRLNLPAAMEIQLMLFDLLGRPVKIVAQGHYSGGAHTINLKQLDLPSGLYFLRLKTPEIQRTIKVVMTK